MFANVLESQTPSQYGMHIHEIQPGQEAGKVLQPPDPALQASPSQLLKFCQEVVFLLRLKPGLVYSFPVGSANNSTFYLLSQK